MHTFGQEVTNWKSLTFASLYSYNFIPRAWYSTVLGHTWSLAVEEHFYLVWPWVFVSFAAKFRKLIAVLVIFIIASFVVKASLQSSFWLHTNFFIDRWSFIAGSNIAYGCLAALLIFSHPNKTYFRKCLATKATLFVGIFMWFSLMWVPDNLALVITYSRGLGLTLLISWIYLNQNSVVTNMLEFRPLNYLGEISYGIYMYQGFFLATGPYRGENQTWPLSQDIGIILVLIVTPLSYHFFEKPITNLKFRFQKKIPVEKSTQTVYP